MPSLLSFHIRMLFFFSCPSYACAKGGARVCDWRYILYGANFKSIYNLEHSFSRSYILIFFFFLRTRVGGTNVLIFSLIFLFFFCYCICFGFFFIFKKKKWWWFYQLNSLSAFNTKNIHLFVSFYVLKYFQMDFFFFSFFSLFFIFYWRFFIQEVIKHVFLVFRY